jgi:hypothetical protein
VDHTGSHDVLLSVHGFSHWVFQVCNANAGYRAVLGILLEFIAIDIGFMLFPLHRKSFKVASTILDLKM